MNSNCLAAQVGTKTKSTKRTCNKYKVIHDIYFVSFAICHLKFNIIVYWCYSMPCHAMLCHTSQPELMQARRQSRRSVFFLSMRCYCIVYTVASDCNIHNAFYIHSETTIIHCTHALIIFCQDFFLVFYLSLRSPFFYRSQSLYVCRRIISCPLTVSGRCLTVGIDIN